MLVSAGMLGTALFARPVRASSAAAGPAGLSEAVVDGIVQAAMAERHIPGALLVVMHKGRVLVRRAYGLSHIELAAPARPEHLYGSGSTGKMFTATAIMQLVAAGRVRLDDPVARHLPRAPAAWAAITVDQLMRHRAGLKDYDDVPDFRIALEWTPDAFIDAVGAWPLEFAPGTRFRYSNSGYVLLGFIVERASGMGFADYMKQHLFAPAGMTTAQVDDIFAILPGRAQGYAADEADRPRRPDPVSRSINQFGDGSLLFSADDLIAWEQAVAANRLISAEAQHSIETATAFPDGNFPIEDYGAGLATRIVRGHRLVSHSGVWNGFGAWIGRWPDDGLAIMACTNSERGYPAGWAPRIAGLIDPALAPYEPIADDDPARTRADRDRLARHLAGGYRTDGSNAQQRAHAVERGPLTDDEQVQLVAVEGRERLYAIGHGGYTDWIAGIDRRGRIRLTGA